MRVPTAAHVEDDIVYTLSALGFGPAFETQLQSPCEDEAIPARIAAEHRGAYEVWSAVGAGRAQLARRRRRPGEGAGAPGVGDWVLVDRAPGPEHTTLIERVLDRRTLFTRGAAGGHVQVQVIAANVDLVFVVCGLDADFNLRRIERYLARIWASGAQPVVILNKADVCSDLVGRVAAVEGRAVGVSVYAISALHAEGIAPMRALIREGMTVALVGSSGAGKSTLVNAVLGEDRMRTGAVRASDGRGCHVTTHRQLVMLPGGGLLLDTPGMRELQLLDDEGLDTVFADLTVFASRCRFRDCRHGTEPGCAVREAVEAGDLDADRLEHYRELEREAAANELRADEHARRQSERVFGQLVKEATRLRRWKGGKH